MEDVLWPVLAVAALAGFCALFPWAASATERHARLERDDEPVRRLPSPGEQRRRAEEDDALYSRQLTGFLDPTSPSYHEDRNRLILQEPSLAAQLPPLDDRDAD